MSVRTETTASSSNGLVRLHLELKDPAALQFARVGDRLRDLLKENERLNAKMLQDAENARAALLERERNIAAVTHQVEEESMPLEFAQAENLEREIGQLLEQIKRLALKVKESLQAKVLYLETQITSEKAKQEEERLDLEELEDKLASLNGIEEGSIKTKWQKAAQLEALRKQSKERRKKYVDLIDEVIATVKQRMNDVEYYTPKETKNPKTEEEKRLNGKRAQANRLHSALNHLLVNVTAINKSFLST